MKTISATIIVKNEQEMLPRCLESIKHLCDEIIIVDTGSTDKTVKIAESFGATVYHHPWQDDFSLHRNQAHDYASGLWHFVIDADEELVGFNIAVSEEFKERLTVIPQHIGALVCTVNEDQEEGTTATWLGSRFFRASANPRWRGIVHNKCKFDGFCAATDIILNHYGYHLSPEGMAAKHKRTNTLLEKRIAKDPDDFDAMFYLCQGLTGQKKSKEAVKWGIKCLETVPIDNGNDLSFFGVLYFWIATNYLWLRDGEKAYAWACKGRDLFPDDLDLAFTVARIGYESKRDDLVKEAGAKYLELLPGYRNGNKFGDGDFTAFENGIDPDEIINRTIFTVTEGHEEMVRGWLNG